MAFGRKPDNKIIPDAIFAGSPLLQMLQSKGLYDQDGSKNTAPKPPPHRMIPDYVFAELGGWFEEYHKSRIFRDHIAPRIDVDLPFEIVCGIVASGLPVNPPIPECVAYMRQGLLQLAKKAEAEPRQELAMSAPAPNSPAEIDTSSDPYKTVFTEKFTASLMAFLDYVKPKLCSGALPLS